MKNKKQPIKKLKDKEFRGGSSMFDDEWESKRENISPFQSDWGMFWD